MKKVLVPLLGKYVAPRFDLATEAFICMLLQDGSITDEKTVVLARASSDELCHLAIMEKVDAVVCGGIEDEYYQFLTWKHVDVYDSVTGSCREAVKLLASGRLEPGECIRSSFFQDKG